MTDWENVVWDEEIGDFVPKNPPAENAENPPTTDTNGKVFADGDTAILTRDLDVKGVSMKLKRGTKVKIRLGADPKLVECKIGKTGIFLKTEFLKKI